MSEPRPLSDLARLLSSIRWTLETHVAPDVQGSLAQSYVRTLLAMLRYAESKAAHDWHVLREDLADIDAVIRSIGVGDGHPAIDLSGLDTACMEAEIAVRDRILSGSLPTLDPARREAFDGFVLRRIERQGRFLPDVPPTSSF